MDRINEPKIEERKSPESSVNILFNPEEMALLHRFSTVENLSIDEATKKILLDHLLSWEKDQDKIKKSGERYVNNFDMYD